MPFLLVKEYPRLWSLNSGMAMVVTDLHGDWETYQRYRDRFIDLRAKGKADVLIFTGDLIHSDSDESLDRSVEIVLNVIDLQTKFGDAIIYLCGNHELPHIYRFGLAKGKKEYTSAFEAMMSQLGARPTITKRLMSLPFYLRTASGVSLSHAGATPFIKTLQQAIQLFAWDHQAALSEAHKQLEESDKAGLRRAYAKLSRAETYEALAKEYLSVNGTDDPRYDDLLVGFFVMMSHEFELVRSALFTRCEQEHGTEKYDTALSNLLQHVSSGYITQKILVSGHMAVQQEYQVISGKQLRFTSGQHAASRETRRYLLFDAGRPVESMEELVAGLYSI
jgi:hypothetical protein